MREIKTEAQTLDLSKKVTVEVSLAELIAISASLLEVNLDVMERNIAMCHPYNRVADLTIGNMPDTNDLINSVDDILVRHIAKEDE
ncbi:hypothetical protein [Bacillus safensis]|uniref:hypothetical protein n=1 Tax=Bacillus safensis TaxID=561879 RepID=UPI0020CE71A4|nr:hypothetical protein [Bacillus safensis]MCP9282993.1 hypothetical protein [Bacillus safensis]